MGDHAALQRDYTQIVQAFGGPSRAHPFLGRFRHYFTITPRHLDEAGAGIAAFAALEAVEMVGLWFAKRWAEYLTFVATAPSSRWRCYELTSGVSALKLVTFVINLAIALYLLWAKRLFGLNGGGRAEERAPPGGEPLGTARGGPVRRHLNPRAGRTAASPRRSQPRNGGDTRRCHGGGVPGGRAHSDTQPTAGGPNAMSYQAEYIWIDGTEPSPLLRSKTRIVADGKEPGIWGFDGSSTNQAAGSDSDCVLRPVFSCPDPLRGPNDKLVMCEVLLTDFTPHPTNTRAACAAAAEKYADQEPWFGIEQEYTFLQGGPTAGLAGPGLPGPAGARITAGWGGTRCPGATSSSATPWPAWTRGSPSRAPTPRS